LLLKPIASNAAVTECLGRFLEKATDCPDDIPESFDNSVWDSLDAQHYTLWRDAISGHKQRTQELVEYRRESLSTSHRARIALLEEQLNQATNEKIQRMRQSQIAEAEIDYARRVQELEIALERADIIASPVSCGVIHICDGDDNAC